MTQKIALTAIWQVVREDDNGVIYLIEGGLSEEDARRKARNLEEANRAKPHPHKQSYAAEPQQPRLMP